MVSRRRRPRIRIRLHVGIATIFVVIVAALSATIIWNYHRESSAVALQTADDLFLQIARKTEERVDGAFRAVKTSVDAGSAMPGSALRPEGDGLSHAALEAMIRFAEARKNIFSVFVSYDTGDWFQLVAMHQFHRSSVWKP